MGFKKIDDRIRILIENNVNTCHRSMFLIVGDKGRDEIAILYNILCKSRVKANPTVLWCYKNEVDFNKNKKKKMKKITQQKVSFGDTQTLFENFITCSKIRFTYYKESHKILGNTFGMLILQDFEALTPNVMARTIETVEGGGIVCFLLSSIHNLRQLYTLSMDIHSRYRTPNFDNITFRFNERFLLSLNDCLCLILDDSLSVLPIFSKNLTLKSTDKSGYVYESQLKSLISDFYDCQPVGILLTLCRTLSQAQILCKCYDFIAKPNSRDIISLTASRGRGKSALLGLIVSGAIMLGMSNIYVIAPDPENLITFFQFVSKGLISLGYSEKSDFNVITESINQKLVTSIQVLKTHRQNIQYLYPQNYHTAYNAELIVCDEAAAIPLPLVKKLIGPHLLFISSTINGYEGTGRSLSLKLIKDLRTGAFSDKSGVKYQLFEFSLTESIRYADQDPIENWLNKLLCLDCEIYIQESIISSSDNCKLYYVNRDTLFSYHKSAEGFLQKLLALFVSSHYKNSPNDLQMMADAPSHHIFVLLAPSSENTIPDILCAIQVSFEGSISSNIIQDHLNNGQRGSGDLIPWIICQQFCEPNFAYLKGLRIVRIATHPNYIRMGYGTKAVELLIEYFKKGEKGEKIQNENLHVEEMISENLEPRSKLPPLLIHIDNRKTEYVDYIGVSYGLTADLLKFWKKLEFIPVYLRQTCNELTGEYSNIMIRPLHDDEWVVKYYIDFRSRFLSLLSYSFKNLPSALALSLVSVDKVNIAFKEIGIEEFKYMISIHDLKRLENYTKNLCDFSLIMDLIPLVAKLCLTNRIPEIERNWIQLVVILSLGLQHRSITSIQNELNIPSNQITSMFNKVVIKTVNYFNTLIEGCVEKIDDWKNVLESNIEYKSVSVVRKKRTQN